MRALVIALSLIAPLAAAAEARADEPMPWCLGQARAYFERNPGPIENTAVTEHVIAGEGRMLFRCPQRGGLPEIVVDARRVGGRWRLEPLGDFDCPRYEVRGSRVTVRHADVCPARWYHPQTCEARVSRVDLLAGGHRLRLVSRRRFPICDVCPDSTDPGCVKHARRAARALYDRGRIAAAARLMTAALDHVEENIINASEPSIDPWAINDALFYLARSGGSCEAVLATWSSFAATSPRSRRALAHNRARCERR